MVQVAIVGDEALLRAALRSILESPGAIGVVADCDGHQALVTGARARPDLVPLDAVMPEPDDGLSALRALRDLPAVAMLAAFDTGAHLRAATAAAHQAGLVRLPERP